MKDNRKIKLKTIVGWDKVPKAFEWTDEVIRRYNTLGESYPYSEAELEFFKDLYHDIQFKTKILLDRLYSGALKAKRESNPQP